MWWTGPLTCPQELYAGSGDPASTKNAFYGSRETDHDNTFFLKFSFHFFLDIAKESFIL